MPPRKMPKKKPERNDAEDVVDSFDSWLIRQPAKPALAKHGFIAEAKI
jgi:hypothetical protein